MRADGAGLRKLVMLGYGVLKTVNPSTPNGLPKVNQRCRVQRVDRHADAGYNIPCRHVIGGGGIPFSSP